jgi:hypothetical protein
MGRDRIPSLTLDQPSAEGIEGQPLHNGVDTRTIQRPAKPVLPKDLPKALGYLGDQDLDRLLGATISEVKRRGRLPPSFNANSSKAAIGSREPIPKRSSPTDAPSRRRQNQNAPPSLARGQINAVRAAFKAGITPSRIARQFGLTQSDVRRALTADEA